MPVALVGKGPQCGGPWAAQTRGACLTHGLQPPSQQVRCLLCALCQDRSRTCRKAHLCTDGGTPRDAAPRCVISAS